MEGSMGKYGWQYLAWPELSLKKNRFDNFETMSCIEGSMGKYGWRYLARPTLSQLHRHQLQAHPN